MLEGLFTIPAGVPFLDALAAGLLRETAADPTRLSQARIFLPTRRACQAMADAFLRVTDGKPLLLPRLEPLGDLDPEDWHDAGSSAAAAIADLPPPIAPARRQLLLARLILKRDVHMTPDQALKLADALGRWLDQVQIHDLDPADLTHLVPDEYAEHWAETLQFLALVTEHWPAILADEGAMDAVARRKAVIAAQIQAWQATPPQTPVIAAGSTGSLPATAGLMRAILDLPAGAVVLPGLDLELDEPAWACLPEGHPQFGLSNLLGALDRRRDDVLAWPLAANADNHARRARDGRAALLRMALRPAEAPDLAEPPPYAQAGLNDLCEVAAPGPEAEARAIALAMRDFLERTDRQTAALVTADRSLARRVAEELSRWRIAIDDSAGEPLLETGPGLFLRLVAEAACQSLAPVPLLALLKHPLTASDPAMVQRLELTALRGLRPAPGIDGLRHALAPADAETLAPLLDWLETALQPLSDAAAAEAQPSLAEWLSAHVQAAEALAAAEETTGADRLWADETGEAAALALDGLFAAAADFPPVNVNDYPAVFEGLLQSQTVRPRYGKHPRLAILGPLEARLQCPQLAILGGLNEGSWPPEPECDPWMGRPMRQDFGLPLPEWRIGLAAHDFAQAFAAPEVWLTRAQRVGGAPTVPARWLSRLELSARTLTGMLTEEFNPLQAGARTWLDWAEALDQPQQPGLALPPMALPPAEARFHDLSVTDVERWLRDPYGHYARHILHLRALSSVDEAPDAGDRGEILHQALKDFVRSLSIGDWPADALERLLQHGRTAFGSLMERPGVQAFWWRRFERMAAWYVSHEAMRWPSVVATKTEHKISSEVEGPDPPVALSARLDRLDRLKEAGFAVIDYKSGVLPTVDPATKGWSPQLPLEGMLVMLAHPGAELEALEAWAVGGARAGRSAFGEAKILTEKTDPTQVSEEAWDGLKRLLAQFADPTMPYLAEPRSHLAPRYSDYRHLARIMQEGGDA